MNIHTDINNIKLKKFHEINNKTFKKYQANNEKQKETKEKKISELFSNKNKSYKSYAIRNKTPDMKAKINLSLTHESFYKPTINNKLLNKILLPEKRDKINKNMNIEQKHFSVKINKLNNYLTKEYIMDNHHKKAKKISALKNSDIEQLNNKKIKNGNNHIFKNKKKVPEDNMRNKFEGINNTRKYFEVKKYNNDKTKQFLIKDYIKNENEIYQKAKNNITLTNNNDNNANIIFNNTVKKSFVEQRTSENSLKILFTDQDIENILLLNNNINKIKNICFFDPLDELCINNRKEEFNGYGNNKLLYVINDEENYIYKNNICSTLEDYDNIINNNLNDKILLSQKILQLHERNWYKELIVISDELKAKRENIDINDNFNNYLKKIIKLYEHFNWLINSIGIYYNIIFQNNKQLNSNFVDEINLPDIDSPLWKKGFKWKGLFINILSEKDSKHIKNELKALNYFFFDYIHVIQKYKEKRNNQLSNNIIFPLIGYIIINGIVIYVSVLINPDKSFNNNPIFIKKFLEMVINHNKGYIDYHLNNNYYNNKNSYTSESHSTKNDNIFELVEKIGKKFYVEDLLNSKLFTNMCEYHLIPIYGNKFILVNLSNSIPNLFEIKFKNKKKIHLFSIINHKKYYDNLIYNKNSKEYFNIIGQSFKSGKTILEKYKVNISQPLNIKDIIINKVKFRILYEKKDCIKKDCKTRTFVDNLFNYYNNIQDENNNIKYIGGYYVIIYDLIEPIKLPYSLIKHMKVDKIMNNKEEIKKYNYLFYLHTNYISYFLSWCKALNKNSYNIKTYSELKQSMKRFGIISQLKYFSLANIDNEDITDIIEISLLIKLIKYIFNKLDNKDYNNKTKYLFEDERIGKIFFLIKCVLYTNEISSIDNKKFERLFEELAFYINILFLQLKLIDDYLSLGLLNQKKEINSYHLKKNFISKKEMENLPQKISGYNSTKEFLKHIIFIARKKPFLFLSELELKLNFTINPFIKFKSSISIESMSQKLKLEHICLDNNFNVYSYVNSDEIAGLIMSKLIYEYNQQKLKDDERTIKLNDDSMEYCEEEVNKKNICMKQNGINSKLFRKNNYSHPFIFEEVDDYSDTKSDNNLLQHNIPKKYTSNQKSSLPSSPLKRNSKLFEKENSFVEWNDIKNSFFIILPFLCYKMNFTYEEGLNYNNKDLYTSLNNNYIISDPKIFFQFFSKIENVFNQILSCTGKTEQVLLHSLFYMFIIYFFIEKNNKESQKINKKIKEIYSNGIYLLSLADLAIINLFQGLSDGNYVDSEKPYSKSVILLLMLFGDPRGRNNDSHALLQLPLWKIARKTLRLREQPSISQYFLEMYKSLEYFQKDKGILKVENNETYFDYEKNIMNNIKNIFELYEINLNKKVNEDKNIDSSLLTSQFIKKDIYLSHKIFSDENLYIYSIKNHPFLSIEDNSNNVLKKIYSIDFIIYLIKQLQSILIGRYKIYDEKYIKSIISDDIFIINGEEKKVNYVKNNKLKNNNKGQINMKSEGNWQNKIESFLEKNNIFDIFPFSQFNKNKENYKDNNKKIDISENSGCRKRSLINNNKNKNLFSHYIYDELLEKLSYKKNCPSGIVLSFGNNSHYETAHDDYKTIKYPLLIYKLKNIIAKKIYSGWEHNIIISDTNEIYSFGNNKNLQCGIEDNLKVKNPINISFLNNGITAISAACGNDHSLILSTEKNVYSFGNNEDGVLGIKNNKLKSSKFIKIDFGIYNNRIKSISAGTIHNIALTDNGKIFSWGSAQGGQLGLNEKYLTQFKDFFLSTPTLIPMKYKKTNEDMKIIKIACGEAHTLALNDKREVYSWGFGSNGQLGLGFCEDSFEMGTGLSKSRVFTPKKIKTFENKSLISDIQCGKTFSMFISNIGELYSCGVNDLNQLGIQEPPPRDHIKSNDFQCKDFVIPTKLDYFLDMKVEKISCGEAHSVAIIKEKFSNERIIWSWGNNRYGQLGLGDKINFSLPKPVSFLFEYKGNKFESISCGGFHSLCIINHNEDINWIENDFKNMICKIIDEIGII